MTNSPWRLSCTLRRAIVDPVPDHGRQSTAHCRCRRRCRPRSRKQTVVALVDPPPEAARRAVEIDQSRCRSDATPRVLPRATRPLNKRTPSREVLVCLRALSSGGNGVPGRWIVLLVLHRGGFPGLGASAVPKRPDFGFVSAGRLNACSGSRDARCGCGTGSPVTASTSAGDRSAADRT